VKVQNGAKLAVAVGPWRPIAELFAAGQKVAGKLGGDPPSEVLLFPNPKWELADMTLVTDEQSQSAIIAEFRKRKIDVVFDYEHQTLEAAATGNPAPASGWIRELRADKEGLWATKIDWTQKAAEFIRAGEYRYFSPVAFFDDVTKRVLSLHSVALTNTPRTNKQAPLTARAAASLIHQWTEEGRMKTWKQIFASLLKKAATSKPADLAADAEALAVALKADDAEAAGSDDRQTIAAAFGIGDATPAVPEEVVTMLGLEKGAPIAKVKASILTLQNPADKVAKADYDKIVAKNTQLEQEIAASTKTSNVEKLITANRNKISPALEVSIRKMAAADFASTEAMVKELPVLVAGSHRAEDAPETNGDDNGENVIVEVGDDELGVAEPNSASVATTCRQIMKEKGVDYVAANEIRKQREAAGAI